MKGIENMDRMETAINSLAGKDAEKAYGDMSLACNTYGLDRQAFIELIKAQKPRIRKVWTGICWYWLRYLFRAYSENRYDDRNKQSCYTGYHLYYSSIYRDEPLPDLPRESFIRIYIGRMAHDHPTLKQSFSSLVFSWLNYLAVEKGERKAKIAVKEIKKIRGERWYSMPMI